MALVAMVIQLAVLETMHLEPTLSRQLMAMVLVMMVLKDLRDLKLPKVLLTEVFMLMLNNRQDVTTTLLPFWLPTNEHPLLLNKPVVLTQATEHMVVPKVLKVLRVLMQVAMNTVPRKDLVSTTLDITTVPTVTNMLNQTLLSFNINTQLHTTTAELVLLVLLVLALALALELLARLLLVELQELDLALAWVLVWVMVMVTVTAWATDTTDGVGATQVSSVDTDLDSVLVCLLLDQPALLVVAE